MPSNDLMNDSSFIDEGTFMDRDWTWSFNALWNKKSAERAITQNLTTHSQESPRRKETRPRKNRAAGSLKISQ